MRMPGRGVHFPYAGTLVTIQGKRERRKMSRNCYFSREEAEASGITTRRIRLNQQTAERDCAGRYLGTDPAIASSADMNRDFRDAI
jgi:hypothetical protein